MSEITDESCQAWLEDNDQRIERAQAAGASLLDCIDATREAMPVGVSDYLDRQAEARTRRTARILNTNNGPLPVLDVIVRAGTLENANTKR